LLSDRFRCIAPDWPLGSHTQPMHPGANLDVKSVAALIAEFMDKLDLRDVTLVGNDTGGALCQMVAAWHGDRVARLVLTPSDCFEADLPVAFQYFKLMVRIPGATWLLAKSMGLSLNRRLPIAYGWLATIPDDITDAYSRPVRTDAGIRRDAVKVIRSINKHGTMEASNALRTFDRPALIVWPRKLHYFPYKNALRLAEVLPNARVEPIENSQGFVPEDQPGRLADLIGEFAA
jgi:pimeloyl-ACP methyl ester carboxylesterase